MVKKLYSEVPFVLKISTLFFVLWMGFAHPKFMGVEKKPKNLTLTEKAKIALNSINR